MKTQDTDSNSGYAMTVTHSGLVPTTHKRTVNFKQDDLIKRHKCIANTQKTKSITYVELNKMLLVTK